MTNHWVDIKNANVVVVMGGNAAEAHPCGFKWVTEAAFALARRSRGAAAAARAPRRAEASNLDPAVAWAAAALALGGFAAMALQIVWFRFLIAHFGPYRPVFSLLVSVILVGIWLGSHLGGALARRTAQPERFHALALTGFGLAAAAALLWAPEDYSTARFHALATAAAGGPWPLYRGVLGGALAMVALPALLSGAAYPLANALVQKRVESVGARAGALYLGNTLGSVAGSLGCSVLAGRDCIGVMPTGAGKSLTFQIPARLLPGTVLVVSPLISLMKDQVDALERTGFRATVGELDARPRDPPCSHAPDAGRRVRAGLRCSGGARGGLAWPTRGGAGIVGRSR